MMVYDEHKMILNEMLHSNTTFRIVLKNLDFYIFYERITFKPPAKNIKLFIF